MASARERSRQRRIADRLNRLPGCVARVLHGSRFGRVGEPDVYGSLRGRAFALEVKQPGEPVRRIQAHRLAEWAGAGAITARVESWEDVVDVLGLGNANTGSHSRGRAGRDRASWMD